VTGDIRISVVICTHNRSSLLKQVLETLCEQTVDASLFEVIVVDNLSTDDTAQVSAAFTSKNLHFRYFLEPVAGASAARNRGWKEASGDYVAFTDDDCKIPPDWITKALEIMRTKAPMIFGGPYFPFYITKKPKWFKDAYGSSETMPEARPLSASEYISEGNLFCSRRLFEQYGGFVTDLGPSGGALGFGEGTEWMNRVRAKEPDMLVYFDPNLYVYHLVKPERYDWSHIIRRRLLDGRVTYRVFGSKNGSPSGAGRILLKTLWHSICLPLDMITAFVSRDRARYPYVQNYWFEHSLKYLSSIAYDLEELRAARDATKS
jgi:glycosyltransferase involved in cell wall biosynthesis